jgi:hypothetical protein
MTQTNQPQTNTGRFKMTEVSGSGWAELDGPGDLAGEFSIHFGDETSFRVWRW